MALKKTPIAIAGTVANEIVASVTNTARRLQTMFTTGVKITPDDPPADPALVAQALGDENIAAVRTIIQAAGLEVPAILRDEETLPDEEEKAPEPLTPPEDQAE